MKRFRQRVKAAALPPLIEVGRFALMAMTFLLYAFLLWIAVLIGQHYR